MNESATYTQANRTNKVPTPPTAEDSPTTNPQLEDFAHQVCWIGHDINSALTVLASGVSLLGLHVGSDGYENLKRVERAVLQCCELARNLVFNGTQNTNMINLTPEPMDVRRILKDIVSRYTHLDDPTFLVHVADDVPEQITAPRAITERVISNLVYNSLKHTQSGKIRICATYWESISSLVFIIEDTGKGISKEKLEKIKAREVCNGRHNNEGLGLGLWLVQFFLNQIGGSFDISSTEGRGTIVKTIIPAEK